MPSTRCTLAHGLLTLPDPLRDADFLHQMDGLLPWHAMADTAAHLVERVIPHVPTRQWVCSFPWGLRVLLGYDRSLCAEVLGAFAEEVSRSLRWRAKRLFGLESVEDAHTGAITFVQRFDSGLRWNVHFHVLWLDGVYG